MNTFLLVAALGLLGASLPLATGLWKLRPVVRILRSDPTSIETAVNGTGTVELEGTAGVAESTVNAPFTGTACLAYECTVERRTGSGSNSNWTTEVERTAVVPFVLESDESIVVDPDGADRSLSIDEEGTVDGGETPPEPILTVLREDDCPDARSRRRRVRERRLEPGESIHVFGDVERRSTPETSAASYNAVVCEGDAPTFVLTDGDERSALVRQAVMPVTLILMGLFSIVSILVFLAVYA
ncbi:E3 ubiquitin ligase [Halovivax gelatinilyticus]|uniref:E3 ubiquitin ligase n=1 Tax=Halovivax gelatinilyticus TaxID=2961597 RepID=UPI0020CA5F68|nr:E3 ubiquitin ligase [Halovivax gelatinilyticus]